MAVSQCRLKTFSGNMGASSTGSRGPTVKERGQYFKTTTGRVAADVNLRN